MSQATNVKTSNKIDTTNDKYMCDDHQGFFKEVLEDWRSQIIAAADQTLNDMQERETYADEVDLATQEEAFRLELHARERGRKLLKNINESLSDIKAGEYGFCEVCGVEIGLDRLKIRPTASKCVECKTIAELKEKHMVF
jgi:DnaK suppressor protein